MKDKVLGTNPPANQTSAITNEITIVVGIGPGQQARSRCQGPDVRRRQAEPQRVTASRRSSRSRWTAPVPRVRWSAPIPPAGQTVPLDTVIQLQVSRGNQFMMPDLTGQFWVDAEPLLARRWAGPAS